MKLLKNMRSNSLSIINKLIEYLPESDIKVAKDLIKKRDFESLQWHVKSAIRNVEKSLSKVPDGTNLIESDDRLANLRSLYSEIVSYKEMLDIIFNEDDENETFPEYFDPDSFSEEDIW